VTETAPATVSPASQVTACTNSAMSLKYALGSYSHLTRPNRQRRELARAGILHGEGLVLDVHITIAVQLPLQGRVTISEQVAAGRDRAARCEACCRDGSRDAEPVLQGGAPRDDQRACVQRPRCCPARL
jgi:hypothetical protein